MRITSIVTRYKFQMETKFCFVNAEFALLLCSKTLVMQNSMQADLTSKTSLTRTVLHSKVCEVEDEQKVC